MRKTEAYGVAAMAIRGLARLLYRAIYYSPGVKAWADGPLVAFPLLSINCKMFPWLVMVRSPARLLKPLTPLFLNNMSHMVYNVRCRETKRRLS